MATEDFLRDTIHEAAVRSYGQDRAGQMSKRLGEIAHWLWLVEQQPLDLLDEEPDSNGR